MTFLEVPEVSPIKKVCLLLVVRTAKTILFCLFKRPTTIVNSYERFNVQNFRPFETHFLLGETSEIHSQGRRAVLMVF